MSGICSVDPVSDDFALLQVDGQDCLFAACTLKLYRLDERAAGRLREAAERPGAAVKELAETLGTEMPSPEQFDRVLQAFAAAYYREEYDLKFLTLNTAHDCNLRCDYCYAAHGRFRGKSRGTEMMPARVALRAVDAALDARLDSGGKLFIDFFGGEPLLNFDVVREVVGHVEGRRSGADPRVVYSVNTNGTLLTREIFDFLSSRSVEIHVSLDGPRELHDAHRRAADGAGSYDSIARNLEGFLPGSPGLFSARATVTPQTIDFPAAARAFIALGFPDYGFDIAFGDGADRSTAWSEEAMGEYDRSFGSFVGEIRSDLLARTRPPPSFIREGLYRLHRRRLHVITCRMAAYLLVATPLGEFYPCYKLTEEESFRIGDIRAGIDHARRRAVYPGLVFENEACAGCWARFLCGGGCPASSLLAGTGSQAADRWICASRRIHWKWILWLYVTLRGAGYPFSAILPQ